MAAVEETYEDELVSQLAILGESEAPITWHVYRATKPGADLPPGMRSGSFGVFVTRFTGAFDLGDVAARVGPGYWRIIGREKNKIRANQCVEIAGVPWPESAYNPPPVQELPPEPAPRPLRVGRREHVESLYDAPAPEYGMDPRANPTFLATQIVDALAARFGPALTPAPAAPVAPLDPLRIVELVFSAMDRAAAIGKPAESAVSTLEAVMGAWEKGQQQGLRARRPETSSDDGLGELIKAALPIVLQAATARPQAPPSGRGPSPGPTMLGQPPAAAPAAPAPVPVEPAPPASTREPGVRDHATWAISAVVDRASSTASREVTPNDVERLASVLDYHLDDDELDAFVRMTAEAADDERGPWPALAAWLPEGSPARPASQRMAATPGMRELLSALAQYLMAEPDDDDDERSGAVSPASPPVVTAGAPQ